MEIENIIANISTHWETLAVNMNIDPSQIKPKNPTFYNYTKELFNIAMKLNITVSDLNKALINSGLAAHTISESLHG